MINVFKSIIILSLSLSLCAAESNQTVQNEFSYIDDTHKMLSETIINWSDVIDTLVSDWLDDI